MTEEHSLEASEEAQVNRPSESDRDRERIGAWHAAAEAAPKESERNGLRKKVNRLERELMDAQEEYARACVQAAAVYGWTTIAEEQGVSSKQLHQWRRRYLPDIEDLSMVPHREMRREEKRVAEIKRQLEEEERLREKLAQHEAKLNRITEVLHGK